MAQQTAVEWLIKELSDILGPLNTKPMQDLLMVDAIKKAKQMEKEQVINAWRNGDNDSMYEPKQLDEQAEQYYNETYNK